MTNFRYIKELTVDRMVKFLSNLLQTCRRNDVGCQGCDIYETVGFCYEENLRKWLTKRG